MRSEIPVLDRAGFRKFGLTTGALVAAIFGIAFPYFLNIPWPIWPWLICAVLSFWAIIAPASLWPVFRGWMRFGEIIGKVTTPLLLTLMFVVAILPTSLLMRLFHNDPMRRRFDASTSYRIKSKQPSVKNLEKPY